MVRMITNNAPKGSVLNPEPPAACGVRAATFIRLMDVVIGALSKAQPALEIKAGMVTGTVMTPKDIKALASLPSKEGLLARFLSLLKIVPTRLVQTLNNPLRRLVTVLDGAKRAKEKI